MYSPADKSWHFRFCEYNSRPRLRRYADPPLILKRIVWAISKKKEFQLVVRRNSSDAPSKLRFCSRPYFGLVVGSLPGRVFQNSFNIFSRPRHALKPPLICLLIRLRDHARYGRWSKSFTFDSVVASWRPSWPNFQKLFFYFFDLKTCSKTLADLFAHSTTTMCATAEN